MTTSGSAEAIDFDSLQTVLKEPAIREDPYPFYRRLREEAPRYRIAQFDAWAITSHHDATAILRDPRLSSSPTHQPGYEEFAELARQMGVGALLDMQNRAMLFMDPPDHTRLRRLAGKAFTARAVEAMRPHIQELVDGMLDAATDRGEMDVIADLAYPLPVTVISEMLGVPVDDHGLFHEWTAAAVRALDPGDDFTIFGPAAEAFEGYAGYFRGLIERRRKSPGDDLLSALIEVEDHGDQLTEDELISMMSLLFVAGHETTVNLVGNGLLALLTHRDELERLRADPKLVPSAVEEMLRYDSPVQLTGRNAMEDVEIDGLKIEKGHQAVVLLGAANRDPAQFPEPDRFDVGRTENRHLSFGGGIHLCLGAPLARVEAQVTIGTLIERFPGVELRGEPERKETVTLRGLSRLPIGW